MGNKVTCTCGHSWNKSDSSKKDATVCHICGKDNEMENGGWLDKYEQGGMVLKQKTNDNYGKKDNPNDVQVSVGDDYVGLAYDTTGRNYSPAWGGQFQKGGFLQPTSSKLPEGYVIPYSTPSTELSVSIGGEDGEPAYLIPSFKYGKKLKDPIDEYRKTGEHLGGPFKTLQEAEKFGEMRHKYVEKGQDIPTPLKTWGDMAMGGTIPGSVGFTYARTGDTPSEGPYAKKTLPSAKNGGWLDAYDVSKAEDGIETDCPVGYYKDANGNCVSLMSRNQQQAVSDETRVARRDYEGERALRLRQFIANQPQFNQGRVLTPYEEAVNAQRKKNYVQKTPNAKLIDGEIRQRNPDRSLEGKPLTPLERKQDASLERAMNVLEGVSTVTGVGSITSNTLRLGAGALNKAIGRNAVSRSLRNFTSRVNPALNTLDEAAAYVQLDPIGIMGNKLNALNYNPSVAWNTANNTLTGVNKNLTNSGIEAVDLTLGQNNLRNAIEVGALQQKKEGGIIQDDRGQWAHPGKITRINGPDITMKGVPYPVLGISDTGEEQMMYPGQDYEFEGAKYVTEYPKGKRPKKAKNGVNQADENSLVRLDQLTNFTNYNTKQPGGWLDNL